MAILKSNVSLKNYSNYKIGGDATSFLEANDIESLKDGIEEYRNNYPQGKIFILGKATNILIDDRGYDGLIVVNNMKGIEQLSDGLLIASGEEMSSINDFAIKNSLSGLEWSGGLPGTLGGAVRGNAGAFGGEIKDCVLEVISMDLSTFEIKTRTNSESKFSYRNSIFKEWEGRNEIILKVKLSLSNGDREEIEKNTLDKINYRKERHPLESPNIGSIFKNVDLNILSDSLKNEWASYVKLDPFPVVPSAKIIFLAGLKGETFGDAQISEKHTNFIINLGDAKSSDVLSLIDLVKKTIKEKYEIDMQEEIMFLR